MIWTAFLLGFLGSFHCVGMCGPIALAVGNASNSGFIWNKILYNLGRSFTYALLGLLIGFVGFSMSLAGIQQGFSIAMGVVLVLLSLNYKKSEQLLQVSIFSGLVKWIRQKLSYFLKRGGKPAFFATGLANGLLPCGMVYMALIAALGMQSPYLGAVYMFFFGIGTIPLLLFLMFSSQIITVKTRLNFQKAIPYLGVILGIIFIFRGLGLGIPGLSPEMVTFDYGTEKMEITVCH